MSVTKAVIFDYVGTLVNCKGYSMEESKEKLYKVLVDEGFDCDRDRFIHAYSVAHEKYRKVRYEQLREVTNAVWVAEALCSLGFQVACDDVRVKTALNVFFQDFIDTLELRKDARNLLKRVQTRYKIGLVSNFTYAPVIYKSLRELEIENFFNAIVVSEAVGWRKPSSHIFRRALEMLQVLAGQAVYIGDSPIEDIKGANEAGMRTIFVSSQFNSLKDLQNSQQKPSYLTSNLASIRNKLTEITE